jgi:hypothetical protein
MAKNKAKDTCLACGKTFTKSDACIQCAICRLWIHHKPCSAVSDDGFKFLSEQLQATGDAYWACRSCLAYSQGITKRVKEVERKLEEVQKEVKNNTKEIERVDQNIDELRKDMDKMKSNRAVESAAFLTAEEYREREARKLNLILHRVKESAATSAELRREADTQECMNVFEAAGVQPADRAIKTCRRIGEKGQVPRPMVVVMKGEAARSAVLEAAKNLRNTDYSEISIVPDLTPAQRSEEAGLSEEAERRNREDLSSDDIQKNLQWAVVGQRGARRLIKTAARPTWERNARGRGGGQQTRGATRGGRIPTVPQPTGRAPTLGVELLPGRKRAREWQAAGGNRQEEMLTRDASEREEEEEEEISQEDEETRSPASKR